MLVVWNVRLAEKKQDRATDHDHVKSLQGLSDDVEHAVETAEATSGCTEINAKQIAESASAIIVFRTTKRKGSHSSWIWKEVA